MAWLEEKYASMVSMTLRNFKVKRSKPYLANFSCPLCGDSESNSHKARGYFYYNTKNVFKFKCHNCGQNFRFPSFLRMISAPLYQEFKFEVFQLHKKPEQEIDFTHLGQGTEKKLKEKKGIESLFKNLSDQATEYLRKRKLPIDGRFRYMENFADITPYFDDDFDGGVALPKDKRIIIPIKNRQGELVAISARAIEKSKLRYVNLKIKDEPMIFNIENVDPNKKVYVLEGVFDSLFFENSVAVNGADFMKVETFIPKENMVVIFDNQPRNREIVKRISNVLQAGYSIVVWPKNMAHYGKDINALIEDGSYNADELKTIIDANTFKGLRAELKFKDWREVI